MQPLPTRSSRGRVTLPTRPQHDGLRRRREGPRGQGRRLARHAALPRVLRRAHAARRAVPREATGADAREAQGRGAGGARAPRPGHRRRGPHRRGRGAGRDRARAEPRRAHRGDAAPPAAARGAPGRSDAGYRTEADEAAARDAAGPRFARAARRFSSAGQGPARRRAGDERLGLALPRRAPPVQRRDPEPRSPKAHANE